MQDEVFSLNLVPKDVRWS